MTMMTINKKLRMQPDQHKEFPSLELSHSPTHYALLTAQLDFTVSQ